MHEFKMPSLGADMDEGKVLEWKVKPGDHIKRGDTMVVVDTQKAAVDLESWDEGFVQEILVPPGTTVPVGTALATLRDPGEESPQASASPPLAPPSVSAATRPPRISPAARKRAQELGVDLTKLIGSGPDGSISLTDIERATAEAHPAPPPQGEIKRDEVKDRHLEMRKAIAAAMSRSKREIPHYYLSAEVPMKRALDWLRRYNDSRPLPERLLMPVLIFKAVALATTKFPEMNGFWLEGAFAPSPSVHIGVAISLREGGLVAPALHDADKKTIQQIMFDLTDLVARARAGSLRSSEFMDPTLTVTNLGERNVENIFGVIYPPQVALVGFGTITERPSIENGEVKALPAMTASLSADHRVSDGHRGGLYLAKIRELLQEPEKL